MTIMRMDEGMDDGDMLLTAIEPICSDDTSTSLMDRLAILGAVTMVKALRQLINGESKRQPQDHSKATYAPKMQKHDGLIDWSLPVKTIERRIRAFDPWPGAFTFLPNHLVKHGSSGRIKILEAQILPRPVGLSSTTPGTVWALSPIGPLILTGDGALCLTAVQPEGSRRMDGKSFLNGHQLIQGDILGVC